MRFRYLTSWLGSLVLIAIWFVPVSFVGTLSNVTTLCDNVPCVLPLLLLLTTLSELLCIRWLCWIRHAPSPVPGIIQGVLPPLFLAILFAILPWLLKGAWTRCGVVGVSLILPLLGLAWYENIPRWSLLSISVYKRYFMFLVVYVLSLSRALKCHD